MQVFDMNIRNDLPAYTFKVDLTGVIFTVRVRYNTRMARWICDVADASDNDIINGLPLILDDNIYLRFAALAGLPVGQLVAIDNRNNAQEQPTRYSFGTTHSLLYVDPTS